MGSIVHMYGTGDGGTDNAIAALDIPMDSTLIGCQWSLTHDADADNEYAIAQLSFRSTYAQTNEDRAVISGVGQKYAITTSGVYINAVNLYVALPDLSLMGGERLYLHVDATAGLLTVVECYLHLRESMDLPSRRRR